VQRRGAHQVVDQVLVGRPAFEHLSIVVAADLASQYFCPISGTGTPLAPPKG
jgi:hypothetical protein